MLFRSIYVYAKTDTNVSVFDNIISKVYFDDNCEIEFVLENRRSFRSCDLLLKKLSINDIMIINDLFDIGSNLVDVINNLDYIINRNIVLLINTYQTTYEFGIKSEINKTVLLTIKQSLLSCNTNIIVNKSNVGRPKMDFPIGWDELYDAWVLGNITSSEFMKKLNLKKATFYNLLSEYKYIQKLNDEYMNKYRLA